MEGLRRFPQEKTGSGSMAILLQSELHIRCQALDHVRGKRPEEPQVVPAMDRTFQATVVDDIPCTVKAHVGMHPKLAQGHRVEVELPDFSSERTR